MYKHVLFIYCLVLVTFNVMTVVSKKPLIASKDESCPFTNAQVYKTLPIDSEKFGHPVEVSWSPNDHYFASGTVQDDLGTNQKSNLFIVWDTQTWQQLLSFDLPSDYYAQSISWSQDSSRVAVFYRTRLMIWNTSTWDHIEITVPETAIYQVFWIDNTSLITLSDNGAWLGTDIKPYGNISRLWDVTDGTLIQDFGVIGIQSQISRVDKRWLVAANNGEILRVYYDDEPEHDLLHLQKAQLIDVNVNPLQLATATTNDQNKTTIQVWDLNNGTALLSTTDTQYTGAGQFLSHGQFLWLNQYNNGGEVWKIEDQQKLPHLDIDRKDYQSVRIAWSPTTLCAAATTFPNNDASESSVVYVFDMMTGKQIDKLKEHKEGFYVNRVAWSANGELLASSSNDDLIIIWHVQ